MNNIKFENLEYLFPDKTSVNKNGKLEINNNDLTDLGKRIWLSSYIYDETQLENVAKNYLNNFKSYYENVHVSYSSKAFSNPILSKILKGRRPGIDVVSGGELEILIRSKFPMSEVNFHGNNKSL